MTPCHPERSEGDHDGMVPFTTEWSSDPVRRPPDAEPGLGSRGQLSQGLQVGEILSSSGAALVADEGGPPDERNGATPERVLHPLHPGSLEIRNAADRGEEIDSVRWEAELDHDSRPAQILATDPEIRERGTERREPAPDALGVRARGIDPDVEVLGAPRHTMDGHGMGTDHEEPGSCVAERAEDLGPVVAHAERTTRPGIADRE